MATIIEENPFALVSERDAEAPSARDDVFRYGKEKKRICVTEDRGKPKDRNVSLNEIWVGLGNIIPLWAADVTLYWRFNPGSFRAFANPDAAQARIRTLLNTAISGWGDACPVTFAERKEGWDFEVVVRNAADCDARGCVLASAFFPDTGQHKLTIYPTMLQQDEEEQIETLTHEIGHIFGLRHFFAKLSESQLNAELFGTDVKFTIMNYGDESVLTDLDRKDLKDLYQLARSGKLTTINGTKIKLMQPFSSIGL
jgi:predicted Zn-dependent protease